MTTKPSPNFTKLIKSIGNQEIVVPSLRNALWSPDFKSFTIKVEGFKDRPPDGWFHPSTHPLWPEALLYLYMVEYERMIREPFDPSSTLAVTAGSFFHDLVQTVLLEEGVLIPFPDCSCSMPVGSDGKKHSEAELYLVDQEYMSRGHSDGVVHTDDGFEFKGLDVDTPILTISGWKTMGEVVEGDEVFAPDGRATKVVGAHDPRMVDCYRITLADGQEVIADEDHLWEVDEVVAQAKTERRVVTTAKMAEGWRNPNPHWGMFRYRVALTEPLQIDEQTLPIDPWLLGAWLGDGVSREGIICVGRQDLDYMHARITNLERLQIWPEAGRDTYRIQVYGIRGRLDALGILGSGKKRIPDLYQRASERQRRELLAGIMDTDGGVTNHQIVVTQKNRELAEDILQLVRSLGVKATMRSHRARLHGRDAGEVWRIQWSVSQGVSPFQMPRKMALIQPGKRTRSRYNAVVEVEQVESRPTRCLTVAHESSMYLVGRGFIPTHNTMNPNKLGRVPKGSPTDPDVLEWFKRACAPYYAQAQEYLRMSGRERMIVVILSLTYPFEMREIHITFDRPFAYEIRDKFARVIQAVADDVPPRCGCAPKEQKACPARGWCEYG